MMAWLLGSNGAFAQSEGAQGTPAESSDEPSSDEASPPESPSTASEEPASPGKQPTESSEAARAEAAQRFQRGLGFYNDGDYALALIEFERAYQLVPDYRVLYNIGQVAIQLSRFARARRALERYLRQGGQELPEQRIVAVERDLAMLRERTAFLELSTEPPGAEVLVDDRSYGKTPLGRPLLLDAGEHRVVVRKKGFEPVTRRLVLAGAEKLGLELELSEEEEKQVVIVERPEAPAPTPDPASEPTASPQPEHDNPRRINPAVVSWTTAGALAGGGIVTGILGLSAEGSFHELKSQPDPDEEMLQAQISERNAFFLAADIMAGAALAAGGVGLYFTLAKDKKPDAASERTAGSRPRLAPFRRVGPSAELGWSGSRIWFRGRF